MLNYLKSRYAASVAARAKTAANEALEAFHSADGDFNRVGVGGWNGVGDPFEHHRRAVVSALAEAVAAIHGYDVPGDIAEFGTMSGTTATGLARAIATCDQYLGYASEAFGNPARHLYLLDSFVGLPSTGEGSVDAESPHVRDNVWSPGSLVGVTAHRLARMIQAHLPPERFTILEGWFSDTVPAIPSDRRFALLHVDSDLYQSAIDVLDSLFGRGMISRGAYVFFDDWNCNRADPESGERRAWQELTAKYNVRFSDLGTYGIFAQRFVIHDYTGSPAIDAPARTTVPAAKSVAAAASPTPTAEATPMTDPTGDRPTSTDVYDHQAASQHYHQTTGTGDMDPGFLPIYERCRLYSMTSADRLYGVYKAVEYVQKAGIEGDFVECGVWRGGSMMVAAEALNLFGGPARQFHLFDTFEGLPEPTPEDVDIWGNPAKKWWDEKRTSNESSDWARSHIDEVRANLGQTGYPQQRIHYIKGMVEDTLPAKAPGKIALLRLDTDWYTSTKHEMQHLFPLLSRNGVIIIDDYGHFKGAKQAVDEYLAETGIPLMLMRLDYTGRIAIKTHGPAPGL